MLGRYRRPNMLGILRGSTSMSTKRVLITGISGQDGSFLAEFLLAKGYHVYGLKRRTSIPITERISSIMKDIVLVDGDLIDSGSLVRAVKMAKPDEVYNLAAQSFVKTSFDQPELTGEVTGLGVTRLLEAIRQNAPGARYYQAGTSEMFGGHPPPQGDDTPFYPRSPYGVAKLYAHWMTRNYRESYGMYACSGLLFNHECVTEETPVIVKRGDTIDILSIGEVIPHRTDPKRGTKYTTIPSEDLYVWDRDDWTKVTCMTATWNDGSKQVKTTCSRGAIFSCTSDHVAILDDGRECKSGDLSVGALLALGNNPRSACQIEMTKDEAYFLGLMAGDGCITKDGSPRFTNTDKDLISKAQEAWKKITGQEATGWSGRSGFNPENWVCAINMKGDRDYGRYIHGQLYSEKNEKRVPYRVLNASKEIQVAFLCGYNEADGLKAGHCSYEFKSFKTVSATLAAGLWWLASNALNQRCILGVEQRDGMFYYVINLNSPDKNNKGKHLVRPLQQVTKSIDRPYVGWLFDLATESGTFHAGIGNGWIHNSPRRGPEFVTQKIARGAAAIKLGIVKNITLGNIEAKRDWGHARDFVEAMWLMLQQEKPDDYVIATGEAHTVREFAEAAFSHVGLNYMEHVETDAVYMRPSEVDYLLGDSSKAQRVLGWKPRTTFRQLVEEMVDYALAHPELLREKS